MIVGIKVKKQTENPPHHPNMVMQFGKSQKSAENAKLKGKDRRTLFSAAKRKTERSVVVVMKVCTKDGLPICRVGGRNIAL